MLMNGMWLKTAPETWRGCVWERKCLNILVLPRFGKKMRFESVFMQRSPITHVSLLGVNQNWGIQPGPASCGRHCEVREMIHVLHTAEGEELNFLLGASKSLSSVGMTVRWADSVGWWCDLSWFSVTPTFLPWSGSRSTPLESFPLTPSAPYRGQLSH